MCLKRRSWKKERNFEIGHNQYINFWSHTLRFLPCSTLKYGIASPSPGSVRSNLRPGCGVVQSLIKLSRN